jgi:hypothetical protein
MMQLRRDEQMKGVFYEKIPLWIVLERYVQALRNLHITCCCCHTKPEHISNYSDVWEVISALHFIKNKYWNQLTNNLKATLRLALEGRSVIEFPFGKVL